MSRNSLPDFLLPPLPLPSFGSNLIAVIKALKNAANKCLGVAVAEGDYALGVREFYIKAGPILSCLDLYDVLKVFCWKGPGDQTFYATDPVKALLKVLRGLALHPLLCIEARFLEQLVPLLVRLMRLTGKGKVSLYETLMVAQKCKASFGAIYTLHLMDIRTYYSIRLHVTLTLLCLCCIHQL